MITSLPRLRSRLRSFVQRMLFVGPRAEGIESGANILINNIVGIIIGLVFMGFGIAWYIGSIDSAKTTAAKSVLTTIATKVQQYYNDNGAFPSPGAAADVMTAMPGYFQSAPCDPVDATCNPASTTASDFEVISFINDSGVSDYIVVDNATHPERTLVGLPVYDWAAAPTTKCGSGDCRYLAYDGVYGIEGAVSRSW